MSRWTAALAALTILMVFAAAAVMFAGHQSIWIDETTQMSGLALPFKVQLGWLTGQVAAAPGVPPDRMPPLSYWLGGIWAGVFGLSEAAMRSFGIVAMLAAAPAIWLAARRIGGTAGALCALGVVFLPAGMIVEAVEIRAYPLFFAFSAWALLAFVMALEDRESRAGPLAALGVLLLAATYTHFFGVVLAGLIWLTLLVVVLAERRKVGPPLVAALAWCGASAGIVPFVAGALHVSAAGAVSAAKPAASAKEALIDTAKLAVHLVASSASFIYPAVAVVALAAVAGLLILAIGGSRGTSRHGGILPWLLLPAAAAFVILPVLKLKIASFDVLAPHYNLWLVPLFALILSGAFGSDRVAFRRMAFGLTGLLFAASLASDAVLLRHPDAFTHGPGAWIAAEITDPARTLVVHDATGDWGAAYFPVYYLTTGRVTQILLAPDGSRQQILPGGLAAAPDWPTDRFDRILFVKAASTSTAELASFLRSAKGCQLPAPQILPAPFPTSAQSLTYCAFTSAAIVVQARAK